MQFIWSLTLYQMAKGYRVVIKGDGRTVEGNGRTAQEAHRAAECKLVVKPWVTAEPLEQVAETEMKRLLTYAVTHSNMRHVANEFWLRDARRVCGLPESEPEQ